MAFHSVRIPEPPYSHMFAFVWSASFFKKNLIKEMQQEEKSVRGKLSNQKN